MSDIWFDTMLFQVSDVVCLCFIIIIIFFLIIILNHWVSTTKRLRDEEECMVNLSALLRRLEQF